jgi:hypothetical protein
MLEAMPGLKQGLKDHGRTTTAIVDPVHRKFRVKLTAVCFIAEGM